MRAPAARAAGALLCLLCLGLLCLGLVAGCTTDRAPAPSTAPSTPANTSPDGGSTAPSTSTPTPRASPTGSFDDWVVGASPLPVRPDGFGEVRPTPPQLRERRLRTVDLLPPPADGRFHSTVEPVTRAYVTRTGLAWRPGCPVRLADLRRLTLSFRGFDGLAHTGELVVHASEAADLVSVFRALFRADFPIEEMRPVTQADLEAPPTGDGNNTSALACRPTVGATTWSAHAYGLAVDLNPFMNPYSRGDLVLPELASAYLDRSWRRPGMIDEDGIAVREFRRIGWTWGGDFRTVSDLHHFSATGR